MRPFEPRKTILVQNMSKYFKIILQTSGHRKVMFMGGEFTGTFYVKPQEKNAPSAGSLIIWGYGPSARGLGSLAFEWSNGVLQRGDTTEE